MIAFVFEATFVVLIICAAISDYQRMKIPNWISGALIALFVAYAWRLPTWPVVGWHFAVGGAVFVAAILAYAVNVFGAGDVKLLGAVALWAGPELLAEFLVVTSVLGGAFSLMILAARQAVRSYPAIADRPGAIWNITRWGRDGKCPYGIPIAAAALLSVPALFVA